MSDAARTLAHVQREEVFRFLLDFAKRRPLAGAIEALGAFKRSEAIPCLIDALKEDELRSLSEDALLRLGPLTRPALIQAATTRLPSAAHESTTSLRVRRSVTKLLVSIRIGQDQLDEVRELVEDADTEAAFHSCRALLHLAPPGERGFAISRLGHLLSRAEWPLSEEIDACVHK